jgi:hypothetical protein
MKNWDRLQKSKFVGCKKHYWRESQPLRAATLRASTASLQFYSQWRV